ncbi:hypothetical protein Y032_0024g891 [Ancylostoma ceylanicum]|uniref:Small integral membrane protein 7 n=1 Tax=Ancylostoma ceylanicum TaxID=53326 RepID=A0A016UXJ6_9BILA|nr:hypothetical protein Y032_0024g891 [Ancylostoma ceylanicum]
MLSELVIASTLFVNACAVLNFKLNKKNQDFNHFVVESEVKSVGDKVREFLLSLQYFRVFIALWNVFIIFLMLV